MLSRRFISLIRTTFYKIFEKIEISKTGLYFSISFAAPFFLIRVLLWKFFNFLIIFQY